MPNKIYILHGSHPSNAVMRAFELKSIPYQTVEYLIPLQVPFQRIRFGSRTVPAVKFEDASKVVGSRAIMRRLDELVPDPPLLPADPAARAEVLAAEEWGDEVLQPIARRLLWAALRRCRRALPSYQEGSKYPKIPRLLLPAVAPVVAIESALHSATDDAARADLTALPGVLDRIDGWIAEGVLGGAQANAGDLQIASSLRLLMTIGDLRPLIAGRPAGDLALRHFPAPDGDVPAGVYPADWPSVQPVGV